MTKEWLAKLPDNNVYTGRELKRLAAEAEPDGPEILSTVQAGRLLGFSPRWWAKACPAIAGAYQDGGYWRIPLAAARSYIAARSRQQAGRSVPRKSPAQAARAGTTGLPANGVTVLQMRPSPVGRRPSKRAKPQGYRLA